jgi:hypothetical protein
MTANIVNDLAEHAGTLVALIGAFAFVCLGLVAAIYKLNNSLIASVKEGLEAHLIESRDCQRHLPERFASKPDTDTAIATLFRRQNTLREDTLPVTYMRKGDMEAWVVLNEKIFATFTTRLDAFSTRIDKLIEVFGAVKEKK